MPGTLKLSGLGTETTFGQSDYTVKVKAAGAGDVLVKLSDLQTAMGGNNYIPYKFHAYRNASLNQVSNTILVFDTAVYDTGSNYSVSTGLFTAPAAGFYVFGANVAFQSGAFQFLISLQKNASGTLIQGAQEYGGSNNWNLSTTWPPILLNANDTIGLYFGSTNSGNTGINVGASPIQTWFNGYILSKT